MRYRILWIILVSLLLVICNHYYAYATDFGPFQGKIVDAETKEPIEGVVVFVEWRKLHAFAGSTLIDAQETLTDKNGDFNIPGIWILNPWTRSTSDALMIVYKSGYKAINTGAWKEWEEFNLRLEYVWKVEDKKPIIMLKQLSTEERNKYLGPSVSYKVTCDKWKLLREEINKENRFRGVGEEGCNE